jgi:restriction endonuclease S subunit
MSQLKALDASDKHEKQDADKMRVSLPSCSGRIQKFAYDNKLKGTDKEACSLMLIMDMLAPGGTAIGVLKEGVFFNRTYKDMRRCLVEKYRVREVISVPQDQFENTSTKTSIIIFDNAADGETTREVVFRDLTVERYDADKFAEVMGEIVIVENRGDIKGISDVVISTATRDELLASSICSLNGKDYSKKEMTAGTDYEMVKLGDICEFMPKSKRNASFGKLGGAFNFYTSSDKVQKCSVADYNEECLIIGSGGTANIKMDNCFSCSADNFIIKSPKYLQYLYYLFKGNMDLLKDGFSGSVLKHISKDYLTNLKIPIPKSAEKLDEWTIKLEHAHKEKCKCVDNIDLATSSVNKYVENLIIGEPFEEVELGTLIDTKSGGYITKSNMESGIYPVYGGGNISNYINIYNRENELIINKDGVSIDCVKYVRDKFFLNHHGWTLTYKTTFYKNYINRWLINHQIELFNLATGSAQKGINKDNFLKMKIQLPINMYKLKGLDDMCTELDKYYDALKLSNNTYNGFINELMQEAMPNCASISTNKAAFTITPPLQPLLEGSLNTHTLDDAKTLPVIIKKKKQIKV